MPLNTQLLDGTPIEDISKDKLFISDSDHAMTTDELIFSLKRFGFKNFHTEKAFSASEIQRISAMSPELAELVVNIKLNDRYVSGFKMPPLLSADIETKNKAFLEAVIRGDVKLAASLLIVGADINTHDPNGMTALHHATGVKNPEMISFLLENGCDKKKRDLDGRTPLDVALHNKDDNLITLLGGDLEKLKASSEYGKPNISQKILNEKLSSFCKLNGASPEFLNEQGNCNGWSFLYQYYCATHREEDYFALLSFIQKWDGKMESLETNDAMPEAFKNKKYPPTKRNPEGAPMYANGKVLFENTINDLVWFQQSKLNEKDVIILNQEDRERQWNMVRDENIDLVEKSQRAKPETQADLAAYLAKGEPNTFMDIVVDSKDGSVAHAVSIQVTSDGKFKYYDSNFLLRISEIDSSEQVAKMILNALGEGTKIRYINTYQFKAKKQEDAPLMLPAEDVKADPPIARSDQTASLKHDLIYKEQPHVKMLSNKNIFDDKNNKNIDMYKVKGTDKPTLDEKMQNKTPKASSPPPGQKNRTHILRMLQKGAKVLVEISKSTKNRFS